MKDLIEIIKANPGCWAEIDNDYWRLYKKIPHLSGFTQEEINDWWDSACLARSDDEFMALPGIIYQADNCYGGTLLKALAAMQGMGLKSV